MTTDGAAVRPTRSGAPLVWALAAVAAVVVGVAADGSFRYALLAVLLGVSVLAAFFFEMVRGTAGGFIDRVSWGIAGAFVVLAAASGVFAIADAVAAAG